MKVGDSENDQVSTRVNTSDFVVMIKRLLSFGGKFKSANAYYSFGGKFKFVYFFILRGKAA